MKKSLVLGMCVLAMGCASAPRVQNVSEVSPLGIISVMSNNDITWYGEEKESGGLLGNLIEKKVDAMTGENAVELLPRSLETLIAALQARGVVVAESSGLLNSAAYASAKEDKLVKASGAIVPAGYKFITPKDTGLIRKLSDATPLESGLYVTFDFTKNISTGVMKNGVARAAVTMAVTLIDADGKVVRQKSYFAQSAGTFTVVGGVYKLSALMELFPEAVNDVCAQFAESFVK